MRTFIHPLAAGLVGLLAGAASAQTAPTPAPEPASAPAAAAAPATSPPPTTEVAAPAPHATTGAGHIPPPPPGKSQVVFFRTGAYGGAAVWYRVRENGADLGKLTNASYFVAVVDPGPHTFTASTENKTKLKLELDDGETQYIRATVQMGFLVGEPNLAPADQAMFELHYAHMRLAKPPKEAAAKDVDKPAG